MPTASSHWNYYSAFFGYLLRDHVGDGKLLPAGSDPCLAWLTLPSAIQKFVEFSNERAGNINRGLTIFLGSLGSLLRPGTGYLLQSPSLSERLPISLRQDTWEKQCAVAFSITSKLHNFYKDKVVLSRNPFEPIAAVLQLPNPLEAVVDMVKRLRAERPNTGGLREAEWARDILLIQLLASNPIRAKNLRELTWTPDNTGELYQQLDGSWHIRINKLKFKNRTGAAADRIYDMPIQASVWPSIHAFLRQYRPLLCGPHQSRRVFITPVSATGNVAWKELGSRVHDLTKRYLWKCPGVGPHAFRHIIATSILKASPGNFGLAAMVLHDRVKTVERNYAHISAGDSAHHLNGLLGATYGRF